MDTGVHAVKPERADLRAIVIYGIIAAAVSLGWGIFTVTQSVGRGLVTLLMRVSANVTTLEARDGTPLGFGGTQSVSIDASRLPADAVTWLRIGEIAPWVALAAAALLLTNLALTVIRRGIFEPSVARRVRITITSACALFWFAEVPTSVGSRIALDALGLEADHWPFTRLSGMQGFLLLGLLLLALTWVEVIVRAGRRLAQDQDGVI